MSDSANVAVVRRFYDNLTSPDVLMQVLTTGDPLGNRARLSLRWRLHRSGVGVSRLLRSRLVGLR